MISFYILNYKYINAFGHFLPFLIYSKFKFKISKSAQLHLGSRVRFGDQKIPEVSPSITSLILKNNSITSFGKGVVIGGGSLIFVKDNANLEIGDNTYFTSNVHLECVHSIRIGAACAISWGVSIIDDDHHKVIYKSPKKENRKPKVEIGDHVWIGCNVTILKNTVIGQNSIIAAGSVVKGEFPNNVLIGGNPARVLKNNVSWE